MLTVEFSKCSVFRVFQRGTGTEQGKIGTNRAEKGLKLVQIERIGHKFWYRPRKFSAFVGQNLKNRTLGGWGGMGSDGAEIRLIFYDTLCSTWNILAEDSSMCEGLHYTYSWRRVSMRNRLCKRNPRRIEAGNGRTEADSGRIWEDWGGEAPRPRFFIHSTPIGIKSSFFLLILIQSKSNHRHIIFDSDSISN